MRFVVDCWVGVLMVVGLCATSPAVAQVPEAITTGTRMILHHQPPTVPGQPKPAGQMQLIDIVWADDDTLVASTVMFNADGQGGWTQGEGGEAYIMEGSDLTRRNGYWCPLDELGEMQSDAVQTVTRTTWQTVGGAVDVVIVDEPHNGYRTVYEAETGLFHSFVALLERPQGEPDWTDRASTMSITRRDVRPLPEVLLDEAAPIPPAMARGSRLHYEGEAETAGGTMLFRIDLMVREQSEYWVGGDIAMTPLNEQGAPMGRPQVSSFVQGPGTLEGYWLSPQLLASLEAGQVDRDDALGMTYDFEPPAQDADPQEALAHCACEMTRGRLSRPRRFACTTACWSVPRTPCPASRDGTN